MALDPKVWGPHYWFVLHTIALTYPLYPNETIKKKYYDLIQNFPLFIPIENMGNSFSRLLDKYPVVPYLDSRESFIKWTAFIHNKVNISLGIPEKTLDETLHAYYKLYEPKEITIQAEREKYKKYMQMTIITSLLMIGVFLYRKS